MEQCTKAKLELFYSAQVFIDLHLIHRSYSSKIPVKRSQLSYAAEPILKTTVYHVRNASKSCGVGTESVHRIVPVGGSSRLHAVTDIFAKTFSRGAIIREDVDPIVSIGAAVTALQCVCAYLPEVMKAKYFDIFSKTL